VISMRRAQLSFGDGLIAAEVGDLWEDWMRHADQVLVDEGLLATHLRGFGAAMSQEPQPRPGGLPPPRWLCAC